MSSLDLTNCDKEKIHLINYVQGHGVFVAVSPLDLKIHHASANLPQYFSQEGNVHQFIGKKLHEIFSNNFCLKLQELLRSGFTGPVLRSQWAEFQGQKLDIFIFKITESIFAVEIEKISDDKSETHPDVELLNEMIKRMQDCKMLPDLAREACRAIRQLTGMDRVMLYKFFPPSMYGEVVAEDKIADTHSFNHHRFPATDIPKPARDLYMKNHVRVISDSQGENFEVLPHGREKNSHPIDMTESRLRGVSLIHLEYLKNMGVRGSVSFAIIIDRKLWGLLSCHHLQPIQLTHAVRAMCETISNNLALGISLIERIKSSGQELFYFNGLHKLFHKVIKAENPMGHLFREGQDVLNLFNSTGMALVSDQKRSVFGMTPLQSDLQKLYEFIMNDMEKNGKLTFTTDELSSLLPEFSQLKNLAAGVLAVRINEMDKRIFMVLRPEYVETIQWGGDPRKNLDARKYSGIINPRESFATWNEEVKNKSEAWNEYEVKGIEYFRNLFFDSLLIKEELMQELHAQIKRQKS